MLDLLKTTEDLMRFRTVSGDLQEIQKCFSYCRDIFKGTGALVDIYEKEDVPPVLFIRNKDAATFDLLLLGHLDVVPAEDALFTPVFKEGKLYGRGSCDMKSFAAVGFNTMLHALETKTPLSVGILYSADEEIGSRGLRAFLSDHPDFSAKVVLDNDVVDDIGQMIVACKNPVFVRIKATGVAAHGAYPWGGEDANERLIRTLSNIRKFYPYYSADTTGKPKDTWTNTLHFAKIGGGAVRNVVSDSAEALCDFRLIDADGTKTLESNLAKAMEKGVAFEIVSADTPVIVQKDHPAILKYRAAAEKILKKPLRMETMGGATDSRLLYPRSEVIVMHSGTGGGLHAPEEWVDLESVQKLAEIQIAFLEEL